MRREFFRSGRALSVCCLALVGAAGAFAQAQGAQTAPAVQSAELPSAKSLVERHIAAAGGREALLARSSAHVTGTVTFSANGMSGKLEIFTAKPNKMFNRTTIEGIGEVLEGFDGTVGWTLSPMTGPMLSSPKELEQKKLDLDFYGDLNVDKKYKAMKTLEKTTFEGRPCFKVALTKLDGTDDIEYFDAETGLRAGRQATRESPMGPISATESVVEYKKFGAFLMPAKIKQSAMGVEMLLAFDSVEHDKVDPSVFDLPPAIKALVK